MNKMFRFVILIQCLSVISAIWMSARAADGDIDVSNAHIPMVYVSTSGTEAHFNVLVPRLKNFAFKAWPANTRGGKPIVGEILGDAITDPDKAFHHKILKVKISGLTAGTEYKLQIYETSSFGDTKVDERVFSAFDNTPTSLKFVTGSCMSDERRYEKARQSLTVNMLKQNPDLIVLSGDEVYVDSFDFVTRHKATPRDVWARYERSFDVNPLFHSYKLIPTIATWDDHDTGIDNGNKNTETLVEARRVFLAFFGSPEIAGVSENGKTGGVERVVTVRGQNFVLTDNRSFRSDPDEVTKTIDRYGHLGQAQEEWLIQQLAAKKGFFWLVDGGMWGSDVILDKPKDKPVKRLTEGFHADHPTQYAAVMNAVNASGVPYGLISGDIHFTQFIEHSPLFKGTPRYAPFKTLEIVASPLFSFIFEPKPNEKVFWKDPQRIAAVKQFNFVTVDTQTLPNGLSVTSQSFGQDGQLYIEYGTRVVTSTPYEAGRRKLRVDKSQIRSKNGKVRVLFLDADSTIRIAASGNLSANTPTDVILLPGVAKRLKAMYDAGEYDVFAIVSNQNGVSEPHTEFGDEKTYEGKFKIADQALQYTIKLAENDAPGLKIHYYDFAEASKTDYYHKPNIGMGKELERNLAREGLEIDWSNSSMMGDSMDKVGLVSPHEVSGDAFSDADLMFAFNLRLRILHPQEQFGWTDRQRAAIMAHDPEALKKANCEAVIIVP